MKYNDRIADIDIVISSIRGKDAIVVYRGIGGIGDAVMITGAVHGLRREYGSDIIIIVATIPYCAPIFYYNPDVDYIVDSTKFDRISKSNIIYGSGKDICRKVFESVGSIFISLSHECPCAIYESSNEPNIHKSRQELFARACDIKYRKGQCKVYTNDEELEHASKYIPYDKYIVFQSSSANSTRDLPKYHCNSLTSILSSRLATKGYGLVSLLPGRNHKNIIHITNTSLRHIISIVSKADMLVGIDSMGIHVAGALDVPIYGIFGPTNPAMRLSDYNNAAWYKGYSKCKRQPCWYHPCIFRQCMKRISMGDLASDIVWQLNINKEYGDVGQ